MLTGKIALVTGAGRGIGAEIARTFAREGAAVIINYNGSKERAEKVAAEIIAAGGKAETYQCNVADDAACKEMIDTCIKSYGRIDILVNNAGITRDDLLMRMSEEDFDAVMDTNLKLSLIHIFKVRVMEYFFGCRKTDFPCRGEFLSAVPPVSWLSTGFPSCLFEMCIRDSHIHYLQLL